jgi:O-antigen/teichoic acid export membrane protein
MLGRVFQHALPFVEQALSSLGTFGTLILGARSLDLTDQGALGLAFMLLALNTGVMVSFLFQPAAVVVHGRAADPSTLNYRKAFTVGGAMLTTAMAPIFSLIWWALVVASGRQVTGLELTIALVVFLVQLASDFKRRSAYVVETAREALLISALTTLPRLVALALLQPATLSGFLLVLAATAIPGASLSLRDVVRARYSLGSAAAFLRSHGATNAALLVVGPLAWLCQSAPAQLLGLTYNIGAVGILTTLRSITNAANLMIEVVDTQLIASMARARRKHGLVAPRRIILRLGMPIFLLWLLGLIALALMGRDLVGLLAGETYATHAWLLLPLWGSSLSLLLYRLSSVYFQTAERGDAVAVGYAIGTLWSLIVSVALVPPFGLTGAALALMIGGLGITAGQVWSSSRRKAAGRANTLNTISDPEKQ